MPAGVAARPARARQDVRRDADRRGHPRLQAQAAPEMRVRLQVLPAPFHQVLQSDDPRAHAQISGPILQLRSLREELQKTGQSAPAQHSELVAGQRTEVAVGAVTARASAASRGVATVTVLKAFAIPVVPSIIKYYEQCYIQIGRFSRIFTSARVEASRATADRARRVLARRPRRARVTRPHVNGA
ncbi:hypothetical protein EVAR_12494_1 [Eumeta japonica]|uniref:Uncharacterized protein n=1 Tax=Eumeta variegata TaxID=151549 RepID=A0A4C1TPL1_EUMVA|nr:hypothetical protein EVAR_12494_1 [Eumeta japonica]